ncbi:MAG TPA: hypothetical protein VGB70_07300 [Allosphingosinicella sp.]|jgi:hypothetical protein
MNIAAFLLLAVFAEPAATQPDAGASEQPKAERKICRRIEASESRLAAKRVCKTEQGWKDAADGVDGAKVERARRGN